MYMISRSLQSVSCTVHRVFLMLSTSSEVDYVPAIDLTTYGLELTFFFFWWGRGVCACACVRARVCVCVCVQQSAEEIDF